MKECRNSSVGGGKPYPFIHIPQVAAPPLYHASMRAAVAPILTMLTVAGCSDPSSVVGFEENDPAARFRAVQKAAHDHDEDSVKPLIGRLESDDAAERVFAIGALERLTGQTLGYDHAAARAERAKAVQRWVDWYTKRQQATPRTTDQ